MIFAVRSGPGRAGLLGEPALAQNTQLRMDDFLVFAPDPFQVAPQPVLDFTPGALQRILEIPVLVAHRLAELILGQRGAMLERRVQFRNGSQHVNFAAVQFLFPSGAPLGPVRADILQFSSFGVERVRLTHVFGSLG